MKLSARIDAMVKLGEHLRAGDEFLDALMQRSYHENKWFTIENQEQAVEAITTQFLERKALESWVAAYEIKEEQSKNIGLVLTDNIPLAGFQDVLAVLMAGHHAQIKLPEKDKYVLPYLIKVLGKINPATESYFSIVPKLQNFDAVIATRNDKATRYLETYFQKYPNIIRKIRKGVAVLDGSETREELVALGKDVFQNFGLGARNIAKLYVPKDYPFEPLLETLHEYRQIVLNDKYKNNFDYHYALYIINRAKYLANGCIMLKEEEAVLSPIANLHYEYYESIEELVKRIETQSPDIELIASQFELSNLTTIPFGKTQQPSLFDYASGVDTMQFLTTEV
ncbi:MAG: acyl-CoA reductase [Bacteroidota bacterium]